MDRLTMWDNIRQVYVIKPDAPQGKVIQRLGELETMFERSEKDDTVDGSDT